MAPYRGNTLSLFCKCASKVFNVTRMEKYDDLVWQKHLEVSKG